MSVPGKVGSKGEWSEPGLVLNIDGGPAFHDLGQREEGVQNTIFY